MDPIAEPSAIDELACPICAYSLRGLPEPRCPECGYAFNWDELRSAQQATHRYLYEHGRGIAIGRMFRTFGRGWRTKEFWQEINPGNVIYLWRLRIYWVIAAAIVLLPLVIAPILLSATALYQRNSNFRSAVLSAPSMYTSQIVGYGSTNAFLDAYAPFPWSTNFYSMLTNPRRGSGINPPNYGFYVFGSTIPWAAGLAALWAPLTLLLLGIFSDSLNKVHIRRAQLWRCVVYSGDLFVLMPPILLILVLATLREWGRYASPFQEFAPLVVLMVLLGIASYRLSVAFGRYLRMPQSRAVVVITQVIVGLLVLVLIGLFDQEKLMGMFLW